MTYSKKKYEPNRCLYQEVKEMARSFEDMTPEEFLAAINGYIN
jgi:hypothetical protein